MLLLQLQEIPVAAASTRVLDQVGIIATLFARMKLARQHFPPCAIQLVSKHWLERHQEEDTQGNLPSSGRNSGPPALVNCNSPCDHLIVKLLDIDRLNAKT